MRPKSEQSGNQRPRRFPPGEASGFPWALLIRLLIPAVVTVLLALLGHDVNTVHMLDT
jgi:hypothetical protein